MRGSLIGYLLASLLFSSPALAKGPEGVWQVDEPAWARRRDDLIRRFIGRIPAPQLAQLRQRGVDVEAQMRASIDNTFAGALELRAGGKAISKEAQGQQRIVDEGQWVQKGKDVVITFRDATVRGPFEGERISLKLDPSMLKDHEARDIMRDLVIPMVRR